jgi:hypothetical protein
VRAIRSALKEQHINSVLFSFGLIIAAGYAWRFFNPGGLDRHRVRHALSVAILNVFLPALSFGLVVRAPFGRTFAIIPMTGIIVMAACLAAAFVLYRLAPWFRNLPRPAIGVLIIAAIFGNVTFLGLPLISETLGAEHAYTVILYDSLASTPLLFTLGVFIAARYGSGKAVSWGASLKRVLTLPPLWGLVAGVLVHLSGIKTPALLLDTALLMGKAVVPIMIFTIGLALDFQDVRRVWVVFPAVAIKMLIGPIVAWWAGSYFGLGGETLKAVTIIGAMPVMVISLILADEFELDVPLTALCIAVSTVALFFTMPLVMNLLF